MPRPVRAPEGALRRALWLLALGALIPAGLGAQDTTRARVDIRYTNPKVRPALVVLPAPALDSVRAIMERDLDHSDRFVVIPPVVAEGVEGDSINWAPYRAMNAELALELTVAPGGGVLVRLYDVATGSVRNEGSARLDVRGVGEARMGVHRLSDEVVRWATGSPGIAATRLLYVNDNRVWRIDADGYGATPLTAAGRTAYSPTWSPDGERFAYTELADGQGPLILQTLATGSRVVFPSTQSTMNITPRFSPDGTLLAFARAVERSAYALHQARVDDGCCPERLTAGRFADNLNPTYSPDGRRIAFVSTRAGSPQIYVMSVDGTNQELLVPFDYGITGGSYGPEWSPDGLQLAFHREGSGGYQVWIFDLTTERARQVSSEGSNEDPAWAPDGRHLIFSSTRTGRRQLHVIDLETFRVRVIPTSGAAKLPSWSPRLNGAP